MRLDVRRSPVLSALIKTLATVPNEVAKQIRAQSKAVIVPEFKKGLAEQAPARVFFSRLVNPSTAYVSDRGVKLVGGSNRAGMFPRETEFGAYREEYNTYTTRRGKVTRRTQRQFWHYKKTGWVFYPTVVNMIPRIASLWAQTALRTIHETVEKATK
ncbi:hypothetical protein ACTU6V_12320 [Microbacterium sp. A204]|uniref:hypothetical protein n=1 Tax=Microbacterium sp. A204 TaxID=3457321 RepID=UPI003FCF0C78